MPYSQRVSSTCDRLGASRIICTSIGMCEKSAVHKQKSCTNFILHYPFKIYLQIKQICPLLAIICQNKSNNSIDELLIEQSHKYHNASVTYPKMHHSKQKCAHFCSEWCIVEYDRCIVGFVNWDWFLTLHLHLIRPEFIVAYDITNITINSFSSGDASRHHRYSVGLLYNRTNFFKNTMQCHYNLSKFLPNLRNSSLMMARYGLSVASTKSDLYFASVTAVLYAIYHVDGLMQERLLQWSFVFLALTHRCDAALKMDITLGKIWVVFCEFKVKSIFHLPPSTLCRYIVYRQVSNISRTKFQHFSRTVLQLSLPNPLKPDVKSRMKM